MRRLAIWLLLLAAGWLPPPAGAGQSDLTPTIYDVHFDGPGAWVSDAEVAEGCAQATTGRTLLPFGTRVMNLGPDDLVIGDPGCPDCTTSPGAVCQDSRFICSEALGLPHFQSAAHYELLDPTGADVVVGGKRGYCFNDDECSGGKSPVYTDCGANQGLSVGCTDDYESSLRRGRHVSASHDGRSRPSPPPGQRDRRSPHRRPTPARPPAHDPTGPRHQPDDPRDRQRLRVEGSGRGARDAA